MNEVTKQQALEALERMYFSGKAEPPDTAIVRAFILSQPDPAQRGEAVAWMTPHLCGDEPGITRSEMLAFRWKHTEGRDVTPLYAAPQPPAAEAGEVAPNRPIEERVATTADGDLRRELNRALQHIQCLETSAHALCSDLGIPPGEIGERLRQALAKRSASP